MPTRSGVRRLPVLLLLAVLLPCSSPLAQPFSAPNGAPQQILVRFRPGVSESDKAAFARHLGARSTHDHPAIGWRRLDLPAGRSAELTALSLDQDPGVEAVEPVVWYRSTRFPNDSQFLQMDALYNVGQLPNGFPGHDISATRAWDITTGDTAVLVAILDTGMDYLHPDLAPQLAHNPGEIPNNGLDDDHNGYVDDAIGWDFVANDADPYDDQGHGTHVSGTIGAVGDNGFGTTGVLWHTRLLPLKFLDAEGFGSSDAAIAAVEYAVARGARVINASWGGFGYSRALFDAVSLANDHGVLFVAAAGNNARNLDDRPFYPASLALPNVISVAATDNGDRLVGFSNYGRNSVDLGAPGVNILSCLPGGGWTIMSGTSMSTPHVVGVGAMLAGLHPDWTPGRIRDRILATVDPVPSLTLYTRTGGRLNAFRAVANEDHVPPAAVRDLRVRHADATSITLEWTATGDDGNTGRARRYLLVSVPPPLDTTLLPWYDEDLLALDLIPGEPGQIESTTVGKLPLSASREFLLMVEDEWYNRSGLSNRVIASTEGTPQILLPGLAGSQGATGSHFQRTLWLQNPGTGTLEFHCDPPVPDQVFTILGARPLSASLPPLKGQDAYPEGLFLPLAAHGGPDGFGYRWRTSDDPGGPAYEWIQRPDTLHPLSLKLDDQFLGGIAMPFQFPFYGASFESLVVTTNGMLSFTTPVSSFQNPPLPSGSAPEYSVAPFWDDFNFHGEKLAYAWGDASRFVVEWSEVPLASGRGVHHFQVVFQPDGELHFNYQSLLGDVESATVGIQDGTRTRGLCAVFNDSGLHSGLTLRIRREPTWARISPGSGRVPPGGKFPLTLDYDARGLPVGIYDGRLDVHSNDPARPLRSVGLSFATLPAAQLDLPAPLQFGRVAVGAARTLQARLTNAGSAVLTVHAVQPDSPEFTVLEFPGTLAPGASGPVTVRFEPTSPGVAHGSLSVVSTDPFHGIQSLEYSAEGFVPGALSVAAETLHVAVPAGASAAWSIPLGNVGTGPLHTFVQAWTLVGDQGVLPPMLAAGANRPTAAPPAPGASKDQDSASLALSRVRGPEGFGYRARTSEEPLGPVYRWEDIESPARALPDSGDDWTHDYLPVARPLPLYGNFWYSISVCSNGWFSMYGGLYPSFYNVELPNKFGIPLALFPWWDDLVLDHPTVYFRTDSGGATVTWKDARHFGTQGRNTFQARLEASGRILYQYQALSLPLNSATAGLEGPSPENGLSVTANEYLLHSGNAVEIVPRATWLTLAEERPVLAPNATTSIQLQVDATRLFPGTYPVTLGIDSDDPVRPHAEISVLLEVVEPVLAQAAMEPAVVGLVEGPARVRVDVSLPPGVGPSDLDPASARWLGRLGPAATEPDEMVARAGARTGTISLWFDRGALERELEGSTAGLGGAGEATLVAPLTVALRAKGGAAARSLLAWVPIRVARPSLAALPDEWVSGSVLPLHWTSASAVARLSAQWSLDAGHGWQPSVELPVPGAQVRVPIAVSDSARLRLYFVDILGRRAAVDAQGGHRLVFGAQSGTLDPGRVEGLRVLGPGIARGAVRLRLALARPGPVAVDVYDLQGRHVRSLFRGEGAGERTLNWDLAGPGGLRVSSGVYFVRLQAGGRTWHRRVVVLR